jgi:thiol-disulfide isomerase/thioredoxin
MTSFCLALAIAACSARAAETPKVEPEKKIGTADKVDDLVGALKNSGAKVILLNVWSADCSPCLAEMPILARLSDKFKDNAAVAFMGLCLSGEAAKTDALDAATKVVQKKQIAYRNFLWTGKGEALLDKFNILGTPYTLFVSAEGKVLGDILEMPEDADEARELIETTLTKVLAAQK